MKSIKINHTEVTLEFSENELILLGNAINEVCNGIGVKEFSTLMGVSEEKANDVLKEINLFYYELKNFQSN